MDRYSIILNKKPPPPPVPQLDVSPRQYIYFSRIPRQELFPDDEYKGAEKGYYPKAWEKLKLSGKFTDESLSFTYRRRIK